MGQENTALLVCGERCVADQPTGCGACTMSFAFDGVLSQMPSLAGHSGTITEVRYSPDDKQLVSVGQDGCVLVWNMYT